MARGTVLNGLLLGVALLVAGQFLFQKLGPAVTLGLLAVVALVLTVGHLVATCHPLAGRLVANRVTRPLVRVVCRVGGLTPPTPADAGPAAGGPVLRTPADFDALNRRLKAEVLGQDRAVDAVTELLRRSLTLSARAEAAGPRPPLAVLFLVGGEGLGKRTLLEAVGRAIYPDGGTTTVDLATVEEPACFLAAARPFRTVVFEHLEAAGPKTLATVRRAVESGELADPAGGPPVSLGGCVVGLTATDQPDRLAAGRAIPFDSPDPVTVARVVVRLMQAECRRHRLTLDYADEAVVAGLAAAFDPAHGFRETAGRVSDVLAPDICAAIEHQHDRLAVVED